MLRGLAILMVVAIHTFSLEDSSDIVIIVRQIFNMAVPLFLAISGFFLANKELETKHQYVEFLRRHLPRVYIPVLLWSLPEFSYNIFSGARVVTNIVWLLICGFSIYYFVALIMQYYVLLPVLQKMVKSKWGGIIAALSSISSILLLTYVIQVKGVYLPLILYAGWSPLWIIFFFMGVYLGRRSNREYSLKWILIASLLFLGLSYVECRYLMTFHGGGDGIKISAFLFSFFAILLLMSSCLEQFINKLKWLHFLGTTFGKYSFGIYLSHLYFIMIYSRLFPQWNQLSWCFKWAVVCMLSYSIVRLLDFLFPNKTSILGLK